MLQIMGNLTILQHKESMAYKKSNRTFWDHMRLKPACKRINKRNNKIYAVTQLLTDQIANFSNI